MKKKTTKGVGGIRKRWILNSISVVVVLVLIAVSAFSIAMASYYYTSMSAGLENTVKAATSFLEDYTESEYRAYVSRYVSAFESKDKLELQFLSRYGSVQESTSGLTAGISPGTPDITNAINNHDTQPWTGRDPNTGERIMAISSPVIYNGTVVGVMRVVTSLKLVDRQIVMTILLALLIVGSSLAKMPLKRVLSNPHAYLVALVRVALVPAALLAVFSQFIVGSPLMLGVIVITNGMPVATNGTLFCVRYGGDLEAMTQTTFISTVLSLVSIPLFAMLIA